MSKNRSAKILKRPKVDNSRKAQRKQKRLQKKVHRQEHYLSKKKTAKEAPKYTPGRFVKRPVNDDELETKVKKKKPNQPSVQEILSKERAKEIKEANKLKSQMEDRRKKMFLQANEEEDKVIKKLEKQLGLNKSKNKNNFFSSDGLDYLLEICDRSTTEQIVAAEKHLAEVEGESDFDEDLAAVTGKEIPKKGDKKSKKRSERNDDGDESDNDELNGDEPDDDISENEELNSELIENEEIGSELSENEELGSELSDDESYDAVDDDEEINEFGEDSDVSEQPEEQPTKSQKSKQKNKKEESTKKSNASEKKTSKERIIKADELSKVFSDDEISHLSGDDDDEEMDDEINDDKKDEKPDIWEDIYGRKRDKEGNVIKEEKGVYIPPHLRNKDSNSDKEMVLLKRQIKSVLNKLTGTNLHWACTSIEQLYNTNSRHSVNCTLTSLWVESVVVTSSTPDGLLTEHVALLATLHANVAMEIGAHFLQELVKKFDEMTQTQQPLEDKQLDNLVACLALMYSFKMYESPLIMDILAHLQQTTTEKHIDCIVTVLRHSGAALRKQAPTELKQFVQHAQDITAAMEASSPTGSRMKFLLEVLKAIKNNNLMKIPNYDPSYQEHLKKMIKGIIRKGNYITPLNIRLEDLLKAEERGKWWVVGSAWEGQPRAQAQAQAQPLVTHAVDNKLLELARKQRMNTDVRRNIFCVIMAAEDYMDAFEKLQHLSLKGQQEREVIHVLLACCLQEKAYNPYYAVLGQKLCDTDRKYQLSIQFAIWDKIKDIENQPKQCLNNLAQFVTHLIMEKGLALSVLKVIQFSDLNKHSVRFMRQILLSVIMNENLQTALEVFHRVSKPPKLHMFRESLKLFIQHFLVINAGKKSSVLSESEMTTLKERAAEVNKILTMFETKLKF